MSDNNTSRGDSRTTNTSIPSGTSTSTTVTMNVPASSQQQPLLRLIRRDEFTRDIKPVLAKRSNQYMHDNRLLSPIANKIKLHNMNEVEKEFAWDLWYIFPRQSYEFVPGESCHIQTGWTVLSYPYDQYSLEMCLTESAIRRGLALCNPNLDVLYGKEGYADIVPVVLNTNLRTMMRIEPSDEYFLLRMVPKCFFHVNMTGQLSDIDKLLQFRKPEATRLHRPALRQFSLDSLDEYSVDNADSNTTTNTATASRNSSNTNDNTNDETNKTDSKDLIAVSPLSLFSSPFSI